jgi:lipoate-protein ligase A
MGSSVWAVVSEDTDPHFNLALEGHLLDSVSNGDRVLFLYRNRDSVVVGRHQNPWIECDLRRMKRDGVLLARRQSGGGAVFHDLGNTNYSLLSTRADYDQDAGFDMVLAALRGLGLPVERNERNDLVAAGRKFSGSAFRHRRGRSFQHGTLLIDADLDRLVRYLAAPKRTIAAKGTESVRSGVINLSELDGRVTHSAVCDALVDSFTRRFASDPIEVHRISRRTAPKLVREASHELRSWEWLFGKTPDFEHRVASPLGWTATLHVHRGVIDDVSVEASDPTDSDFTAVLASLVGCRYEAGALCRRLGERASRQRAVVLCKILEEEIP